MPEAPLLPDSEEARWQAVVARDAAPACGPFLYAVITQGVFCRPGCPSRPPLRRNARFYDDTAAAEADGFRACKRCDPKGERAALHAEAVRAACDLIEAAETIPSLEALAARAGYARHHFLRLFREVTGLTPRSYAEGVRARRLQAALAAGDRVAEAVAGAGFGSESRVYEDTARHLGMTPGAARRGGRGETIRIAHAESAFGPLLVGATEAGVCFIGFAEPPEALEGDLRARFPNGNIGTRAVAQAAPDGHTLVLNAASPLVINQFLYRELGYDPVTSLAPITMLTTGPLLVVGNPRAPFTTIGELIAEARRRPGALNYATAGNGTVPHLATELFQRAAGIQLTNVTYRQTPDATQSVMRGDTAVFFDSPASIQHVRAGTLRALAVTTPRRFAAFPEVPTVAEAGGPEISVEAWYGVLAPAGTAPAVIARLHQAFSAALRRPEVTARIAALGFEPVGSSPDEFARFMATEAPKWRGVIQAAEIRIE